MQIFDILIKTSSSVDIDIEYDLIFKFTNSLSNFINNSFPLNILSSLGILNNISSLNISYSIFKLFPELFLMKSIIISLFASISFVIFKFRFFPKFSIKNKGEPIHFITPSDNIPILLPNTDASSI